MQAFPAKPVPPREFVEEVIPSLFASTDAAAHAASFELKLGLRLEGGGSDEIEGGDWTLHFVRGELGIAEGLAADCALTLVQPVADWRAGLWEGRPRLIADFVERLKEGVGVPRDVPSAPSNPDALRELENLPGRIDAIIEGGAGPDWRVAIQIGPGPIEEAAKATLRIGEDEAEAIRTGELHPLEALITGQLRLEGDFALIIQLQAIAMAASLPPPPA